MKISCLLGSPRPNSNSAAIANAFLQTAESLGAKVEKIELNKLAYRGCQGCMACKTTSDKCVLQDDLTAVLEALKQTDIVVMAMPVYCSDVPGQVKCFIDRTFSYLKPGYMSEGNPSRVPAGKKTRFHHNSGSAGRESFCRNSEKIPGLFKALNGLW